MEYKNTHNEKDFQKYFKKYKDICIEKKIVDEDIWNMDETEFCVGCSKAHWFITLDLDKSIPLIDLDNWEYIILVESISGGKKQFHQC